MRAFGFVACKTTKQLNGYLLELAKARLSNLVYKENPLGMVSVGSFAATMTNGSTPSRKKPDYWEGGSIPWVKTGEVNNNLLFKTNEHITELALAETSVHLLPKNTVVMALYGSGTAGRLAILQEKATTNQACTAMVCRTPSQAFYLFLTLQGMYREIDSKTRGSVQQNLSKDIVASLMIHAVTEDLLDEIRLCDIYDQVRANEYESLQLASLRDALLPKLMSGEIDVSKIDPTQLNSHLVHSPLVPSTLFTLSSTKGTVMETVINAVLAEMQAVLKPHQLKRLADTLRQALGPKQPESDQDLLALFLTAKEVEGCSPKTIEYYEATLRHMDESLAKPYAQIESDDLRRYLNDYEASRGSSKVTIDNIRRIMSSFFSWLEDEDYIVKSPVRRIHRVKTAQIAKEVLSDEELEALRDACDSKRDLAIVDLLASTGMRIGELVRLNRKDVNLQERECLVTGKGNKQRPVYFDARAKLHLSEYLASRNDSSPALFVTLDSSARRVTVGGLELRLRNLGQATGIHRVHPHKFRRTLATHAIDKGMPIEQVQKLLGHAKIDTTMHYAMVNQNNVKASHRKYLE